MPHTLPRLVLAGRTRQERQSQRAGIRLRDYTIAERTKQRYIEAAVARILPFLEAQSDLSNLDAVLCDYIEGQWSRGESIGMIADGLSGLHMAPSFLAGDSGSFADGLEDVSLLAQDRGTTEGTTIDFGHCLRCHS